MAMMPPPPTRFSTTICWPSVWDSRAAIRRPVTSMLPPAAKGTSSLIGRSGQVCALNGRAGEAENCEGQRRMRRMRGAHARLRVHGRRLWRQRFAPQPSEMAIGCCVRSDGAERDRRPLATRAPIPPTPPPESRGTCSASSFGAVDRPGRRAAGAPPRWCRARASSGCASRRHAARPAIWRWRGPGPSRDGSW